MSERPTLTRTFLVADRVLRVTARTEVACDGEDLVDALEPLATALVAWRDDVDAEIEVDLRFVPERAAPPTGEPIGQGATRTPEGVVLDTGAAWTSVREGRPIRVEASVVGPPTPAFARWMLPVSVFVAAGRLGLFHLHAGLVEGPHGGWLLVGPSGASKSTTTLVLAASGLRPRADDVVLVDVRDRRVYPIARPFHLSPEVARAFPALTTGATPGARGKLDVPLARPDATPVAVSAIFFLRGPAPHTEIGRCDPVEAVGHLLDESAVMFVDPMRAADQLDTLRQLVESVPLRTLRPGPDVLSDPGRLREALEESLRDGS